jgi:hypothetical protein
MVAKCNACTGGGVRSSVSMPFTPTGTTPSTAYIRAVISSLSCRWAALALANAGEGPDLKQWFKINRKCDILYLKSYYMQLKYLPHNSVSLHTGRPGDRSFISSRGKRFFL